MTSALKQVEKEMRDIMARALKGEADEADLLYCQVLSSALRSTIMGAMQGDHEIFETNPPTQGSK